jgi:hypothetical protein
MDLSSPDQREFTSQILAEAQSKPQASGGSRDQIGQYSRAQVAASRVSGRPEPERHA